MQHAVRIAIGQDVAADVAQVKHALTTLGFMFSCRTRSPKQSFMHIPRDFQPDVVLSGHSLPAWSGHEVLRIKRVEHISKPITPETFVADVESYLHRQGWSWRPY